MKNSISVWPSIFESTNELISIDKCDAASILQPSIYDAPSISGTIFNSLFNLEKVTIHIFDLAISISFIGNKLSLVQATVSKSHFASANSFIGLPTALEHFTVGIVAYAKAVPPMV
jgi:hypothetical protein